MYWRSNKKINWRIEVATGSHRSKEISKFIKIKLENTAKICISKAIIREFEAKGWMSFVEKLHGYNLEIVDEFTRNYEGEKSIMKGKEIKFFEEIITTVTGHP